MTIDEAIKAKDILLERYPNLQKVQDELDKAMHHARSRAERAAIAYQFMIESLKELLNETEKLKSKRTRSVTKAKRREQKSKAKE